MASGAEEWHKLLTQETPRTGDGEAEGKPCSQRLFGQVGGEGGVPVGEHAIQAVPDHPVGDRAEGAEGELPGDLVGGAGRGGGGRREAVEVLPSLERSPEHPVAEAL